MIFKAQSEDDSLLHALVAQLDRVPGYEPGGQRFKSSPVQFMHPMILHKFACGPLRTNAILFGIDGIGAVIDPAMGSAEKIVHQAQADGLEIKKIFLTHSHWDHIVDAKLLKEQTGALLYVHPFDAKNIEVPGTDGLPLATPISGVAPDLFLNEGESISLGSLTIEVIHTPGHSPGSVCLYLREQGILFSGDTLFAGAIGRLDLPTGVPEMMEESLEKLAALPPETKVIPGHGPDTKIGHVKRFYI